MGLSKAASLVVQTDMSALSMVDPMVVESAKNQAAQMDCQRVGPREFGKA